MRISDLEVDSARLRATRAGRVLDLTEKEFALLSLLIHRAGEIVSRRLIAQRVWQVDIVESVHVNALVSRLRAKVDVPFYPRLIHTVRGSGYYVAQLEGVSNLHDQHTGISETPPVFLGFRQTGTPSPEPSALTSQPKSEELRNELVG